MVTTVPIDMAEMSVVGTPGTSTITLNAATSGYQTFAAAGVTNGETISYGIKDTGGAFEVGQGVYGSSGPTLTRGPIFSSAAANAAISATSAALVYCTLLAEDLSGYAKTPSAGVVISNGTIVEDAVLVGLTLTAGTTLEPTPAARVLINSGTVAATGSSSIASDWSAGNVFNNTMTASATLANPSNALAGATAIYIINAGTSGTLTLSYGSSFVFNPPYSNASPPSIGAGINVLSCVASGTATIHSVLQPGTWA